MGKMKYSTEMKLNVLQLVQEGMKTILEICDQFNISQTTLYTWKRKHEKYGIRGIDGSLVRNGYSKETKVAAVKDYLSGYYTQSQILNHYEIGDRCVLMRWIKKYTSHSEELNDSKRGLKAMTKSRTTTYEERLEIVKECLANEKNHRAAAEKYSVSYDQVYKWVKKFEQSGEDALIDRRGRSKLEAALTNEDKLKLELKQMALQNERLRAENQYLKKLKEIEGRHR